MDKPADFAKRVPIFLSLDERELEYVAKFLKTEDMKAGQTIFREGQAGDRLYIVARGVIASSSLMPNGKQREISRFVSGEFFGEMAIFEDAPRSASCYVVEDGALLSFHSTDFFSIIMHNSAIANKIMYAIMNIVSQRLKDKSEFLSDLVHWGEAAHKRAITDDLTGIYNRRFLDDELEIYFESARKSGKELSVMMIDLDRFRVINEDFGLQAGDRVLKRVADLFKRELREGDILARYGGDEFVIILPNTKTDKAHSIAESIRLKAAKIHLLKQSDGTTFDVSLSIGISSHSSVTDTIESLKESADQALYRAKKEGRNRVISTNS